MTKTLTFLFDKWWRPLLFWLITVGLVVTSEVIQNPTLGDISISLFGIALLGLFASCIYQLFKGRWIKGILTGLLFGSTIVIFVLYGLLLFFIETVDGDHWADNLTIPSNISLADPIDLTIDNKRPDSLVPAPMTSPYFQLYNSFQPGLYEYDFWTGQIESGTIYLKAYEITQEYALSADRLVKSSAIKVYNPTDTIARFGTKSDFTIYEGDWGKPYAARFEVWYKPDGEEGERMLLQKNYKIEGWMR
jgi:hypothetical protein